MKDLIDRQAAIDAIEEYADRLQMVNWKENPNVPYKVHSLNWCINTIRDLPSAQPDLDDVYAHAETEAEARYHAERKKGKWIDKNGGIEGAWNCCSVCGEQAIDLYDFCPNCGADMREPEDIPMEYFESEGM